MRNATVATIIAVLLLSASPGCYYDNEEELYPNTFCDTVNTSYSAAISAIIESNCATPGCHVAGGTGTGNFTVFSELSEQVSNGRLLPSIRREASSIPMPPGGTLRACEIRQLELWVAAGAQNN
ncbi:MAG: hypothetical protein IPG92_13245 [Flavobacteriales bacterium]|nr:hypothetical protein [Flavobacteriales bacterium]